MFVAGSENGRLSREVMRCKRRRLFFLPSFPSPSTSDKARRRLKGRSVGRTNGNGRSKANLIDGPVQRSNVKVSLQEGPSERVFTMLTCVVGMVIMLVFRYGIAAVRSVSSSPPRR